jgi:F5/8 type C domain/Pectate lyase superfamily protein
MPTQYAGGPPARKPGWRVIGPRLAAAGAAVIAAAGLTLGIGSLAAASVPAPAHPSAAQQAKAAPMGLPRNAGATVTGMTEDLAVGADASTSGGTVIGPDYTQGDLATEAVGREAVQLTAQGQSITFTTTATANAFDVSYALSQGASGTLSVYVNGTKQASKLSLTSQYAYITTSNIAGSKTHHFYNDARLLLSSSIPAGSTVKLEADSGDVTPVTIDVMDFFNVPAAASQPANSVSVVSQGADPTGNADSTSAFNSAISAANSAGESVWIPAGTYLVSSPLQISKATIAGAGDWYTTIKTNEFINNTSAVSGPVNLSGFAIMGSTVGRHDDSSANAINGSLGTGATVNGLWIQDTNVGFWLQYGNTNVTVENSVVLSTDADGLNFNGNATNSTVTDNFIRNTGDDGLAIWSYPAADSGITFSDNTIEQPNLANGIADYGGSNNTITGNVIMDTQPLGSGLAISNEQFLSPGFAPLSGTITVSDNTLIRTGAMNPNWGHAMGAMRFDAYDYAFSGVTVNVTGNTIDDSPYEAFEIVGGGGEGYAVTGLNFSNDTVDWTGTTVFQAETPGSASVSGVTATNVGVAGTYNYGYPNDTAGTFIFNLGSGNSGWSTTPVLTSYASPVGLPPSAGGSSGGGGGGTPPPPPPSNPCSDLSLNQPATSSGYTQTYSPGNAVDGNTSTYWESTDNSFPQWIQVDLGSAQSVGGVVMDLPPSSSWGTRTQTLSISGSTDGSTFTTLAGSANYTFNPSAGNTATATFTAASVRYVRLTFTANSAWPAGQLSELQVEGASCSNNGSGGGGSSGGGNPNLAQGQPATSSGYTQTYTPGNAVDGDTSTYWESTNSAFPQWLQVDLGSAHSVGRLVLDLPPSSAWATRAETLSVSGSTDGSTFTTLAPSAAYTFNPSSGNTVTITFSAASVRYLRLTFTANTGWPAGQLSELQAYAS